MPSLFADKTISYPTLAFDRLRLKIKLGFTAEERHHPQDVAIDLKLFFENLPPSCTNDKLDDTICYDKLSQRIKSFCLGSEFKLLEYLCYMLHCHIREVLPDDVRCSLRVEKCKTPIPDLEGSASFTYSDL